MPTAVTTPVTSTYWPTYVEGYEDVVASRGQFEGVASEVKEVWMTLMATGVAADTVVYGEHAVAPVEVS